MGKKQTRQNRGARTGGHEHNTTAETTKRQAPTIAAQETTTHPTPEVSHKQPRKFGHN
ncbi:hypothetical protein [Streptomyces sp. CBMA152]|uniref:hypothetical protein n=1 Tax=Streptomyces sp. CBMA152 TaxID=1896312 RepID=UPI0016615A8A|nr:hypothetical protein [Streptomyces sp. CBMA152]